VTCCGGHGSGSLESKKVRVRNYQLIKKKICSVKLDSYSNGEPIALRLHEGSREQSSEQVAWSKLLTTCKRLPA
jgi:hypothetical protein